MPTGYTASLYEGKEIEFKDFAMNCARAFGALVSMRDDPSGATIPEELKPSEYHKDRLDEVRKDLREFLNNPLPDDEILKIIDKNYKLSIEDN